MNRNAEVWRVPRNGPSGAAVLGRAQLHADGGDDSRRVDERGPVVLRQGVEERGEVGAVREVEAGDLDGGAHADAAQLAGVAGEAPHEGGPDPTGAEPVRAQLDDVREHVADRRPVTCGAMRLGEVDRRALRRPLDAVPRRDTVRRRQADPPATEALHDEGAGVDGEVDGRRLVLAGAVEAHQPLAVADDAGDERRAAVGEAAGDGQRDVGMSTISSAPAGWRRIASGVASRAP